MKKMFFMSVLFGIMALFAAENDNFPAPGGNRQWGQRGGFEGGNRGGGNRQWGQRGNGGFEGGNRGGGARSGMMQNNSMFVEWELSRKYPEEYAKIEKMREDYENALSALAEKGGVKLPESRDKAFRELRKIDQAGFDAAMEKMKTSPREGFSALMTLAQKHGVTLLGGFGGNRRQRGGDDPAASAPEMGKRSFDRPDLPALRRKYPAKMKEYDALRRKDPAKAKELLLEIINLDKSVKK